MIKKSKTFLRKKSFFKFFGGKFKSKFNLEAFTLVELIIVIAIIAVLAVSAFMVLTKWLSNSRDSRRLADVSTVVSSIEISFTEEGKYPMPDDYVSFFASGDLVGYQGTIKENFVNNVDSLQKAPLDPNGNYYSYRLDDKKKKFQVIAYLENDKEVSYVSEAIAENYENLFMVFRGYDIGIITDSKKTPVDVLMNGTGSLDIINTTDSYTVNFEDSSITGTGKYLITLALATADTEEEKEKLLVNDNTLVGYWKFDDASGTTATDSSSYSNDGALIGGAEWREGKIGGAVYFDGDDDLIQIPYDDSLNVTHITMSAYINLFGTGVNTGNYPRIISRGGVSNSEQYAFWYNYSFSEDFPELYHGFQYRLDTNARSGGSTGNFSGQYHEVENNWMHVVVTQDGNTAKLYVNGNLKSTHEGIFIGDIVPNTKDLIIANSGWAAGYNRAFYGLIDDVRLYDRVLSSAEIANMY